MRGEPEGLRFKTGAVEEETGEDGEVVVGGNHVGIKDVEGDRVGRRYRRRAPAERTGSDRAARAREGRARPKREAGRDTINSPPPPPTISITVRRVNGLGKSVLWVRSRGKGSRLRD